MGKKMNHKAQIRMMQKMQTEAYAETKADEILRGHILTSLLVLGDKFGFGKVRMERYLKYIATETFAFRNESKNGTVTTSQDIYNILKNEYKLDL